MVVSWAPKSFQQGGGTDFGAKLGGVEVGKLLDAEAPAVEGTGEDDIALLGLEGVLLLLVNVFGEVVGGGRGAGGGGIVLEGGEE